MREAMLQINQMVKCFGSTKAVSQVDLTVYKGEIRGLIGENGSGKSTLSSIVAGALRADSGEMHKQGEAYQPVGMVDAQKHGVAMIVQEMGTIPGISVAENVFIGKEAKFTSMGLVSKKRMHKETKRILELIGADDIDPAASINDLNFEDRKIVEIARAMYDKPDILIVDETTTALSQRGRKIIYSIMQKLKADSKSVLFISHDLDELMEVCDALSVLRDGVLVGTLEADEMDAEKIKTMMVGREIEGDYYRSDFDCAHGEEVVLSAKNVTANLVEDVNVELHKGEILGIGGLTESGMHELGRLLFGIEKTAKGAVTLGDGKTVNNPSTATLRGLGYVSKNRDQEALMLGASIRDNLVLPSIKEIRKMKFVLKSREKALSGKVIDELSIKCTGAEQTVQSLSGGNKQKVSFGKWIAKGSDILILDCPTRGVDVGVKAAMYQLIYRLKKMGKSIVLISEELPELIGMSDRILIMKDGKIRAEYERCETLSEHDLIQEMI